MSTDFAHNRHDMEEEDNTDFKGSSSQIFASTSSPSNSSQNIELFKDESNNPPAFKVPSLSIDTTNTIPGSLGSKSSARLLRESQDNSQYSVKVRSPFPRSQPESATSTKSASSPTSKKALKVKTPNLHSKQLQANPRSPIEDPRTPLVEKSMQEKVGWINILFLTDTQHYILNLDQNSTSSKRVTQILMLVYTMLFITQIAYNGGIAPLSENPLFGPPSYSLLKMGANAPILVKTDFTNQWWRLFTASFLHVGIIHLISNLITLYIVASKVEMWYGKSMLLGVLLITGLSGNLLCAVLQNLPLVSVGASGALLGFLGTVIGETLLNWNYILFPKFQISLWLFYAFSMLLFGMIPGMDNLVHFGGFISGFFCGILFCKDMNDKRSFVRKIGWKLVGFIGVVLPIVIMIALLAVHYKLICEICCRVFLTFSC